MEELTYPEVHVPAVLDDLYCCEGGEPTFVKQIQDEMRMIFIILCSQCNKLFSVNIIF